MRIPTRAGFRQFLFHPLCVSMMALIPVLALVQYVTSWILLGNWSVSEATLWLETPVVVAQNCGVVAPIVVIVAGIVALRRRVRAVFLRCFTGLTIGYLVAILVGVACIFGPLLVTGHMWGELSSDMRTVVFAQPVVSLMLAFMYGVMGVVVVWIYHVISLMLRKVIR